MKHKLLVIIVLIFAIGIVKLWILGVDNQNKVSSQKPELYWFLLHRKSNVEELYKGMPGDKAKSVYIKSFTVKTGIPRERPTPLPQLLGRQYWIITEKHEEKENPETAPYFLTLDIPAPSVEPFGPTPYEECNGPASTATRGEQCYWTVPGAFGLHGSGGDPSKLSSEDPGSSGCIRHSDEDITFLYNLLEPQKEEIRYYIEDT